MGGEGHNTVINVTLSWVSWCCLCAVGMLEGDAGRDAGMPAEMRVTSLTVLQSPAPVKQGRSKAEIKNRLCSS